MFSAIFRSYRSDSTFKIYSALRRAALAAKIEPLERRLLLTGTPFNYVVTDTSDSVSDTGSLRYAVTQANAAAGASTITFNPTDFPSSSLTTIDLGSVLNITNTSYEIYIQGPGASALSLQGQSGANGFWIHSGATAQISGLEVTGGHVSLGGGIDNDGTLTLSNSTITGNSANQGGGVYNTGTITLIEDTISGNSADEDGGVGGRGTIAIVASTISGNGANSGGGVYSEQRLYIINSTITGNSAIFGAGVYSWGDTLQITDSTISGNSADVGGGVYSFGLNTIDGSVVSGNSGGDLRYNFTGTNDFIGDGTGNLSGATIHSGNPMLEPLGNYGGPTETMPPMPGSPLIGAGASFDYPGTSTPIATDQQGKSRPSGSDYDIGAVQAVTVLNVTSLADDGSPGTLRSILTTANSDGNSIINFDPSLTASVTPGTPAVINLIGSMTLDIDADVTINGPGADLLEVNANPTNNTPQGSIFQVESGMSAEIEGLTISGNLGQQGGAITNLGSLLLADSTISGNSATSGGGIYNHAGASLTVATSTISGNSAANGGAIYNKGTLTIGGSTLAANSATSGGAVESTTSTTTTIANSTMSGNDAVRGGAISAYGTLSVVNTTVANNLASSFPGGGIFNTGTLAVTDSTFSGNAASAGGGIYSTNGGTIDGTIVTSSGNGDLDGSFTGTYDLISDASGGLTGSTILTGIAMLAPLANYGGPTQTMALLPGSEAIGAGSTFNDGSNPIAGDERGISRPQGTNPDIGAFESQGFVVTATGGTGTQSAPAGGWFSRLAISVVSNDTGLTNLAGGIVGFNAPGSGASALIGGTALLNSAGDGSITAEANTITGSYTVSAFASSDVGTAATFSLTNTTGVTSFSGLSQPSNIPQGTASVTLGGVISSGELHPSTSETIAVTLNGVTQNAAINSQGNFSTTFTTTGLAASGTPYTVTYAYAGDSDLGPVTDSTTTTVTVRQVAAKLAFTGQPAGTTAGSPVIPGIQVSIEDSTGALTADTSSVTLAIQSGPNGASLGGTLTVAAVNGVATFDGITFSLPGTYTLVASDQSLTTTISAAVKIRSTAVAGSISISAQGLVRVIGTTSSDTIAGGTDPQDTNDDYFLIQTTGQPEQIQTFPASGVTGVLVLADPTGSSASGADDDLINLRGTDFGFPVSIGGGAGSDTIFGQMGVNDITTGVGSSANWVYGGPAVDSIQSLGSNDSIHGDGGADTIQLNQGNNVALGGQGGALIYAGAGHDTLRGGPGNATIHGSQGDLFIGGSGHDLLEGGAGNDTMIGGSGLDTLVAGTGNDFLDAGSDAYLQLQGSPVSVAVTGASLVDARLGANDTLVSSAAGTVLQGGSGTNVYAVNNTSAVLIGVGQSQFIAENDTVPSATQTITIHLTIEDVNAGITTPVVIPSGAGAAPSGTSAVQSTDASGTIVFQSAGVRTFTLADFFNHWGVNFSSLGIGQFIASPGSGHTLAMTVNNVNNTQFQNYAVQNGDNIVIQFTQ